MKKIFLNFSCILFSQVVFSQIQKPVEWNFSVKKIDDKTYELHLTATIEKGWHIYSPGTPKGGPVPTTITFLKNPLLDRKGSIKEIGKLEQKHEPLFGVNVKQYSDSVDFIQVIKLKADVKTAVKGSVEFMVCNDSQCLPPTSKDFSVSINK